MKIIVWFGCVLGALSASGKVFKSKLGQNVLLECGHHFRKSIIWEHNSNLIFNVDEKTGFSRKGQVDLVSRSRVKNAGKLEISGLKKEDAGKFSCQADDKLTEHTLLVVSVWTSPPHELQLGHEAMLHCEVAGVNQGSAVQWKRPDGNVYKGSPIKLSPIAHSDNGTWVCMFSHDGSSFQEDVNVIINIPTPKTPTSTTESSESSKKDLTVTCLKCNPQPKPKPFAQLSWWVWVALGVGSLVVVLLMVLVIFLCKRTRRRKRMKMNMKNGIHLRPKQYCQCDRPTAPPKPQQGRRKEKPSALHVQPLLMA